MDGLILDNINDRVGKLEARSARIRIGVVTVASPLAVKLGGSDVAYTDVVSVSQTTPVVGDSVICLMWGNDLVVFGKIGAGAALDVAFRAWHTHNAGAYGGGNPTVVFANEVYDYGGNNYNPATGFFTAPVNGIYHFDWDVYSGAAIATGVYWQSFLELNGSPWSQSYGELSVGSAAAFQLNTPGSTDVPMYAGQGASVKIAHSRGVNTPLYGTNQSTRFSGHLVRLT